MIQKVRCLALPNPPAWRYTWDHLRINAWIPLVSSSVCSYGNPSPFLNLYAHIWESLCTMSCAPESDTQIHATSYLVLCGCLCPQCCRSCPYASPQRFLVLGTHRAVAVRRFFPFSVLASAEDSLESCLRTVILENWVRQLMVHYPLVTMLIILDGYVQMKCAVL